MIGLPATATIVVFLVRVGFSVFFLVVSSRKVHKFSRGLTGRTASDDVIFGYSGLAWYCHSDARTEFFENKFPEADMTSKKNPTGLFLVN